MLLAFTIAASCAAQEVVVPECPASVDALPVGPTHEATDPRLRGEHVVVVLKERRVLGHYANGALQRCARVGLASGHPSGHKQRQGDLRTPEGWYRTSDKPTSRWYHAIAIHYPGLDDAERGLRDGLIDQAQHDAIVAAVRADTKPPQATRLGGEILFHGGGASDWTLGCIALEDAAIDELRAGLPKDLRFWTLILP
ncbi:MAG: L,D-transpeptidase family protein [Myxococcales bacterium]|nr:L,D-transpeptidase family protein [Myxococcales bacterium]